MKVPSSLYLPCPECEDDTRHKVLKGKIGTKKDISFEGVVRCSKCGKTYPTSFKEKKPIDIPIIISWLDKSKRTSIELGPEVSVNIDDEYIVDGKPVVITSLESKGKRKRSAMAKDIDTIWAVKFENVRIKISINKGSRTLTKEILAMPEDEFSIGDIMEVDGSKLAIKRIKTPSRTINRGGAVARNIQRIYTREVRG
jgi:predicted Zn finger-like uncharacterized protein